MLERKATDPVRLYFFVTGTDGLTPAGGEAGGQPQYRVNEGDYANTTNTLVAVSGGPGGDYSVALTASERAALGEGDLVEGRYQSAGTSVALALPVQIVDKYRSELAVPSDLTGMIASGTLAHQVLTDGGEVPYVEGDTKPITLNAADGWDFTGRKVFFCMKASLDDDNAAALIDREATVLDARTAEITPASSETSVTGRFYCEWKQYDADGVSNPRTVQQFRLSIRRRVRD